MTPKLAWLAAAVVAVGCSDVPERAELISSDPKSDLQTLSAARVYFGHQSVGNDVLKGLEELATAEGVRLRIVEAPSGVEDDLPGIVHARVGRNREPQTKCDAFGQFLTRQVDRKWDAAVLKFCYADLGDGGESDPARLIESYKRTVASIRTARPDLVIVHATAPLLSDGLGKRDAIKKWLGLGTSNDSGNLIRNQFNDLIRKEYGHEEMFDVARMESTRPDGTRTGFKKDGRFIFSMAPEFTYDEGHLTPTGRRWVAREFARSLASALRERTQVARAQDEAPPVR